MASSACQPVKSRLEASVTTSFADSDDRSLAGESDRQGIGGPARPRPG